MTKAERERRDIARVAKRIAINGTGRLTAGAMYYRAGFAAGKREENAALIHDMKQALARADTPGDV